MNRHFHDARYYLRRAGEHAKLGVQEELAPVEERVRAVTGREDEADEESRIGTVRTELTTLATTAEREATAAARTATDAVVEFRSGRDEAA